MSSPTPSEAAGAQASRQVADPTLPASPRPPEPPRALARAARRGSWGEPRVRFWWLLAICLFLVVGYLMGEQVMMRAREDNLIRNGVPVTATAKPAVGPDRPGLLFPADSDILLRFEYQGRTREVNGQLAGRKGYITNGETVPIRIDPADPTIWTGRTEPAPFSSLLMGPLLALPAALAAAAVALWARRRLLRTWSVGDVWPALVVETQPTALAPATPAARCTQLGYDDNRVFTVYVPARVRRGDLLWVVSPPRSRGRAVAAGWFTEAPPTP